MVSDNILRLNGLIVFDCLALYQGEIYGLTASKNNIDYYLYNLNAAPMKQVLHLISNKNYNIELKTKGENILGVSVTNRNDKAKQFVTLLKRK